MRVYLIHSGISISASSLKTKFGAAGFKTLLNKFTIRIKNPINSFYIIKKIYSISGDNLILPRFAYKSLEKIIKEKINTISDGEDLITDYLGDPTQNQKVVADYLSEIYTKDHFESGATVKMIAGSGKTFLAMEMIHRLKKKALIVVPNVYLLQQWHSILSEFFSVPIGVYYGKKKTEGDIVVAVINSLCTENHKSGISMVEYCSRFGFMILDESHSYCTDKFKQVYRLQCRYMLGLSATPDEREDKTDIISHLNIGKLIDAETLPGYEPLEMSFESEVKVIKYKGPASHVNIISEATGLVSVPPMIENICSDNYRNKMIIREISRLLEITDMNVFVFSDRRSHCELLERMLNDEAKVTMYGGCSKEIIQDAIENARVIFTTYAYSSTGVSIEKLTGLVLATPRKSKARQIIGRIFRNKKEHSGKKRHIVDIVDVNCCFSQQLYKRLPAYRERNSVIEFTCETFSSTS